MQNDVTDIIFTALNNYKNKKNMKTYNVNTDNEARQLIESLSNENQIVFEEVSKLKTKYGEDFSSDDFDDFQTSEGFSIGNSINIIINN